MNPQIWWYLTRASGIVAWLLLTATVLAGILTPAKLSDRQRPAWALDLHRWLAGLTIGFLAIHLAALVADSYVEFTLADLAIPYATDWKPFPVALGIIATWLLIVIQLTSLAMRRLPRPLWRRIHLTSYLVFVLASLHGTLAGTDATHPLYLTTTLTTLAATIFATIYRTLTRRQPRPKPTQQRTKTSHQPPPEPTPAAPSDTNHQRRVPAAAAPAHNGHQGPSR